MGPNGEKIKETYAPGPAGSRPALDQGRSLAGKEEFLGTLRDWGGMGKKRGPVLRIKDTRALSQGGGVGGLVGVGGGGGGGGVLGGGFGWGWWGREGWWGGCWGWGGLVVGWVVGGGFFPKKNTAHKGRFKKD